jgi:hypothetical protein
MSDIMTDCGLPGVFGGGFMMHGRVSRAQMIKETRDYWRAQAETANKILNAPNNAFRVRVVRGKFVQHLIEELKP